MALWGKSVFTEGKSVSGQPEVLLIDLGNTRGKYVCLNGDGTFGDVHTFDSAQALPPASHILLAKVGQSQLAEHIEQQARAQGQHYREIKTQAEAFGVRCAYQNYHTMGVDRWLAILAASRFNLPACCVFDIGTAITCDFLVGKQHLGGWIAPGFDLMRGSLRRDTEQVFVNEEYPQQLQIGTSTEDCVNQGCLALVQGCFDKAADTLTKIHPHGKLLVTGGGQDLLDYPHPEIVIPVDNLVFQGLALYPIPE